MPNGIFLWNQFSSKALYNILCPFHPVDDPLMSCVCSELRPHFSLASESDPAEQEDVDDDGEPERNSTRQSRAPPVAAHDDTVATSGVSTLSSTVSHESHNAQRSVSMELGRMKLETNR